jgi:hypothetical protein
MTRKQELLAMFRVIEAAKKAVHGFEEGEINVTEAVRRIMDAVASVHSA